MAASPTVLLIEDDAPLRQSMRLALLDEGYRVLEAATGEDGLRRLREHPDAVLLDVLLPDVNGVDLCRRIRAATPAPIVIVSALAADQDITRGLAAGADDYVTKPFRLNELAHQLHRLLQPPPTPDTTGHLQLGAVELHPNRVVDASRGRPLALSRTELRLLFELAATPGRAVPRSHLLEHIWGHQSGTAAQALDVHISSLRSKLAESGGAPLPTASADGYVLDV